MTDIDDSTIMSWDEANDHADDGAVEEQEAPDLAVEVALADGTVTRIGPIFYEHIAEQMVRTFEGMRTNTEGAAEARFEIVNYDESKEHLSLTGASMDSVLSAMHDEGDRADGPFPDLWSRLHAQHGYETALRIWSEANRFLDDSEEEVEEEAQQAPEVRAAEMLNALQAQGCTLSTGGFSGSGPTWAVLKRGEKKIALLERRTDEDGAVVWAVAEEGA